MGTFMYEWCPHTTSSSDSAGRAPATNSVYYLRVQLYAYLDDLLIDGDAEVEATQSNQETLQVFIHAGFVVNLKESKLGPTQDLMYIGARFRTDMGKLYLPEVWI